MQSMELENLRQRFSVNESEIANRESTIAKAQQELESLRAQQVRIRAAIDLIRELRGETPPLELIATVPAQSKQPTLRQLIIEELRSVSPLTKNEIVGRLYARGFVFNGATVGSTLSKMAAAGELEKAGHFAYRLKGEVPNGVQPVGTSIATASEQDTH